MTFGRRVMEHRLLACHKALGDPLYDWLSISQIAFNWGFNDLSHFTKAFRARFGARPAGYAASAELGAPHLMVGER